MQQYINKAKEIIVRVNKTILCLKIPTLTGTLLVMVQVEAFFTMLLLGSQGGSTQLLYGECSGFDGFHR